MFATQLRYIPVLLLFLFSFRFYIGSILAPLITSPWELKIRGLEQPRIRVGNTYPLEQRVSLIFDSAISSLPSYIMSEWAHREEQPRTLASGDLETNMEVDLRTSAKAGCQPTNLVVKQCGPSIPSTQYHGAAKLPLPISQKPVFLIRTMFPRTFFQASSHLLIQHNTTHLPCIILLVPLSPFPIPEHLLPQRIITRP
jgi:hypothetical protein